MKTKRNYSCLPFAAMAGVLFCCAVIAWYRAYVQTEVYRREGVEISTWEVLMGAKPAERKLVQ